MIADATHVRTLGNFPTSLKDAVIDPALRTAKKRLTRWIGSAVYDAAETEAESVDDEGVRDFTDDALAESTIDLADAEAYLAIVIGLPSFNMVMEGVSGGDAAGVTMTGTIGENTYRYANPSELEKLQEKFLFSAEQAAQDYLLNATGVGSPGPDQSHAYDLDGYAIDEDWPD